MYLMFGQLVLSEASGGVQDSVSEYSDTMSTLGSREEICDLGEGTCEDRFRVNRRGLEAMLQGGSDEVENAEVFFQRIMEETSTTIAWPSRLKVGAKSKKDPHIRVVGKIEDVRSAKEKILAVLDTRTPRVTLKMDVSYNEHSHIIGRGGRIIQQVMDATKCHIHFPDSNRTSMVEKSNQVSISGEIDAVESARARVRELSPLIIYFELPYMNVLQPLPDPNNPVVQQVQDQYKVQVSFPKWGKMRGMCVSVKGCEEQGEDIEKAVLHLMDYYCAGVTNTVMVKNSMEISPQHHSAVLGRNYYNLQAIMQGTSTQIMVHDATDPNISPLQKSNVTITGGVQNVHAARQQLIGSLPVVLMFDIHEESQPDMLKQTQLIETLGVTINVHPKKKQLAVSVVIKGTERNIANVYEARRQILGIAEGPPVQVKIPEAYNVPAITPLYGINLPMQSLIRPGMCSSPWPPVRNSPSSVFPPAATTSGPPSANPPYFRPLSPTPSSQPFFSPASFSVIGGNQLGMKPYTGYMMGGGHHHHRRRPSDVDDLFLRPASATCSTDSSTSSPYTSPRNLSPTSDDSQFPSGMSACSSPNNSTSTLINRSNDSLGSDLTLILPERRAPGYEMNQLRLRANHSSLFDYDTKKLQAVQAMQQKPVASEPRIPTSDWVGYGFSRSMPESVLIEEKKKQQQKQQESALVPNDVDMKTNGMPWLERPALDHIDIDGNYGLPNDTNNNNKKGGNNKGALPLGSSSHFESLPLPRHDENALKNAKDIASVLTIINLEKYIDNFMKQEVDLEIFLQLKDKELEEQLGVRPFGHRKRMLSAISEIKGDSKAFHNGHHFC